MSASHVEAACGLIDPKQNGILPLDLVPVREVITLLATQLAEVDRLTRELAQAKSNESVAISYAGGCKADLVRSEAELAERTRERDTAQRWFCEEVSNRRRSKGVREGNADTPESVAQNLGWGYLYPEEPQP